ncbi:predicted protein [Lichtheimia corymbifera JMRC:FSU:9682]|uniref:Uncharacterized protein n=1 Tax=Lichtheimia corymbifera JMRC:FSU:9682 TaxID=1263082 RepID=A0A068SGN8_9FUNG|nr:predicted protein [Lichtheimia corymbifera JMRC:FSU:9682]
MRLTSLTTSTKTWLQGLVRAVVTGKALTGFKQVLLLHAAHQHHLLQVLDQALGGLWVLPESDRQPARYLLLQQVFYHDPNLNLSWISWIPLLSLSTKLLDDGAIVDPWMLSWLCTPMLKKYTDYWLSLGWFGCGPLALGVNSMESYTRCMMAGWIW